LDESLEDSVELLEESLDEDSVVELDEPLLDDDELDEPLLDEDDDDESHFTYGSTGISLPYSSYLGTSQHLFEELLELVESEESDELLVVESDESDELLVVESDESDELLVVESDESDELLLELEEESFGSHRPYESMGVNLSMTMS